MRLVWGGGCNHKLKITKECGEGGEKIQVQNSLQCHFGSWDVEILPPRMIKKRLASL